MERLTGGNDAYHDLTATRGSTCAEICREMDSCDDCPIQRAIDRLTAYEDTGLSPEEAAALARNAKGGARQ